MESALDWHTYGGEEDRALAGGVRRGYYWIFRETRGVGQGWIKGSGPEVASFRWNQQQSILSSGIRSVPAVGEV